MAVSIGGASFTCSSNLLAFQLILTFDGYFFFFFTSENCAYSLLDGLVLTFFLFLLAFFLPSHLSLARSFLLSQVWRTCRKRLKPSCHITSPHRHRHRHHRKRLQFYPDKKRLLHSSNRWPFCGTLHSTMQSSENMVRHGNSNPRVIKASSVANKGKIYFQKENCSKQVRCTG